MVYSSGKTADENTYPTNRCAFPQSLWINKTAILPDLKNETETSEALSQNLKLKGDEFYFKNQGVIYINKGSALQKK